MHEESTLAHYIHHLLAEKKITLDDDMGEIDLNQADHHKVAEMVRLNLLGFYKVRIYSLKMDEENFAFIFAGSKEKAIQFYTMTFNKIPMNCHEYPLDFQLARGNEVVTFRDLRKEFQEFPAIVGYFKWER